MGSGELTEWIAYYRLEPFGQERDNWHFGLIASMYANTHKKAEAPPSQAGDFIWGVKDKTKKRQTGMTLSALDSMAVKKNGPDKT